MPKSPTPECPIWRPFCFVGEIGDHPGVLYIDVSLETASATLGLQSNVTTVQVVCDAITAMGFGAHPELQGQVADSYYFRLKSSKHPTTVMTYLTPNMNEGHFANIIFDTHTIKPRSI